MESAAEKLNTKTFLFPIYDTVLPFSGICIATVAKMARARHFTYNPASPFHDDSYLSLYDGLAGDIGEVCEGGYFKQKAAGVAVIVIVASAIKLNDLVVPLIKAWKLFSAGDQYCRDLA